MVDFKATAPREITSEILNFCCSIAPEFDPVFVKVIPHERAVQDGCFDNVEMIAKGLCGEVAYGWLIWEGCVTFEAISHAVWVVNGKYIDVTPQASRERRVLFLPDPDRYNPDSRPAKLYGARIDHPAVHQLIAVMKRDEELVRKYRNERTGGVKVPRKQRRSISRDYASACRKIDKMLSGGGGEK